MNSKLKILLVFSVVGFSFSPASACDVVVSPIAPIRATYDPFLPDDMTAPVSISVTNRASDACDIELQISDPTGHGRLGKSLAYELRDDKGGIADFGKQASSWAMTMTLGPGETRTTRLTIMGPRGQFTAPGAYSGDINIEVVQATSAGSSIGLMRRTLFATFEVRPQLSVNVAGGGVKTTLDFRTLSPGQKRSVAIQTRSNQDYVLEVSSKYKGVLSLEPSVAGEIWSIPYTAICDGERLLLESNASTCTGLKSDTGYGQHSINVEIGAFVNMRAGLYRDLITLEIKPRF